MSPETASLLDKVERLQTALNSELVEREAEVHGAIVALLSGQHIFLLGPPGVGKSFLVDRLTAYVDGTKLFKILMTRFSTPEEVFGPLDIPALEESRYCRLVDGYLPWSTIGWMDEIWKANSSILNALLGILNERTYRNDGVVSEVPLHTLFCASNELPEGEGLAAIYDRVLLRFDVQPVKETTSFVKMLQTHVVPNPVPILGFDDVLKAKLEAEAMPISPKVYDTLAELRSQLRDKGIEPTERRFAQSIALLRAEAWMDGAEQVEREHVSILRYVLWDRPEQQADVEKIVLDVCNPMEKRILSLMAEVEKLSQAIDECLTQGKDDRQRRGMEIHRKLDQASEEYHSIAEEVGSSRRQKELLDTCRERLHGATVRMITEIFKLPSDDVTV